MNARSIVGVAAVVCAVATVARAEAKETPELEPQAIAETFLEQVGRGEVDKAWDALPKGALWAQQAQRTEMLRGQIKTGLGLYGAHLGIERIRESRYSPSITKLTYLMKREQHYFVWTLVFYKPADRWETSGVSFVDQPNALD